jgi:hypothetical protein
MLRIIARSVPVDSGLIVAILEENVELAKIIAASIRTAKSSQNSRSN